MEPVDLSYFFYIKYSKFLVNLNRISQRMHIDPLIEADYINYDYLEAKSVPGQILDRYRVRVRMDDNDHL